MNNFFKFFAFILLLSNISFAQDGGDFAASLNSSIVNDAAKNPDLNNVPAYQGSNVSEAEYYKDGIQIEERAVTESKTNETAIYFNESRSTRPTFSLNEETDPLFKRQSEITNLAHGLTDSYAGCVDLPVGQEDETLHKTAQCTAEAKREEVSYSCSKTPVISCNETTYNLSIYLTDENKVSADEGIIRRIKNNLPDHPSVDYENDTLISERIEIIPGNIDYRIEAIILHFVIYRKACDVESWGYSCPAGETRSGGDLQGETCINGPETREIGGNDVYAECWEYREDYIRKGPVSYVEDAQCDIHRQSGCGQTASTCNNHNGEFCESYTYDFSCSYESSVRKVTLCGDTLVCEGGECTENHGQTQQDGGDAFKQAAIGLAAAQAIVDQIDNDNLTVFAGKALSCKKKALGFENCCSSSGWAGDIGLGSCDAEEKELGLARDAKKTHFVGDYCSDDSIVGCLARKYVYCSYPSKIARVIIEQGKPQISQGFGHAKGPNCNGYEIHELEQLDFNLMDFSELEGDVDTSGGNTPEGESAAQLISDKLKSMYPEIKED